MADTPGPAEPRPAGRRFILDGQPQETARFSLDGENLERYIPDPPAELADKARAASMKVTELPHVIHKARVTVIAALKAEGYSRDEIAGAMGMTIAGVHWCLRQARKKGILQKGMEEAIREMDEEAVPLAIEAIVGALRDKNIDVAMKIAAGRGLLRTYSNNKNEGPAGVAPAMGFQFNFVLPDGSPAPEAAALAGKIMGTSKA